MSAYKSYKELINDIVYLIINKNDFNQAANIIIMNNLTIKELLTMTFRLSILNIAKLSDAIIKIQKES
ncbi:MAG: hypothetical protein C0625_02465 [Arcobacter sp.]|nr:MAG: hypothetical protein C0625_02465 [Arcobacter sp.]